MHGPFRVDSSAAVVTHTAPGVYILSRDGKTADYVGRSDHDVGSRIGQWAATGSYSYFWFDYASSVADAHQKECENYHRYNQLDNKIHPAATLGTYFRCPVSGCGR